MPLETPTTPLTAAALQRHEEPELNINMPWLLSTWITQKRNGNLVAHVVTIARRSCSSRKWLITLMQWRASSHRLITTFFASETFLRLCNHESTMCEWEAPHAACEGRTKACLLFGGLSVFPAEGLPQKTGYTTEQKSNLQLACSLA